MHAHYMSCEHTSLQLFVICNFALQDTKYKYKYSSTQVPYAHTPDTQTPTPAPAPATSSRVPLSQVYSQIPCPKCLSPEPWSWDLAGPTVPRSGPWSPPRATHGTWPHGTQSVTQMTHDTDDTDRRCVHVLSGSLYTGAYKYSCYTSCEYILHGVTAAVLTLYCMAW